MRDDAGQPMTVTIRQDDDDEVRVAEWRTGHQRSPSDPEGTGISRGATLIPALSCARLPSTTSSPACRPARTTTRVGRLQAELDIAHLDPVLVVHDHDIAAVRSDDRPPARAA
jgi:hypothetical protein